MRLKMEDLGVAVCSFPLCVGLMGFVAVWKASASSAAARMRWISSSMEKSPPVLYLSKDGDCVLSISSFCLSELPLEMRPARPWKNWSLGEEPGLLCEPD
ncbi:hypothetical protein KEM55_008571 [Ascosphaera atra]|nr:hypothetical protein KEM55_008571 [Ascosphaera atra]